LIAAVAGVLAVTAGTALTLTRSKSSGDAPADTAAVAPLGSGPAPAGSPAVPSASPSPKPSAIPKAVGGCTRPAGATPKTTVTVVKVGTTVTGYGQQADTDTSWTTRIV
jgi:hypothetical protein